ncbi:DEKNAAC100690 [Brettanomyces naardenensis]|uniref:D-lactate dehydrogenase (cytochrome) n=1 Tax=Brettanomyces naardenensis TaxID=13370 RepID=A0A448YEJ8_BRENA|nr:DEKNAAC100690 [Brettanomyces naardenensis]
MYRAKLVFNRSLLRPSFSRGFRTAGRTFQKSAEEIHPGDAPPKSEDPPTLAYALRYFTVASVFLVGGLAEGYWIAKKPESNHSVTDIEDIPKPLVYAPESIVNQGIKKILHIVGPDAITVSEGEIVSHSGDPSGFVPPKEYEKPYCVVFPTSAEQVSKIVKVCYDLRIPVVPYSGGTSIEGHYIPTRRGISIDLSRMNKVIALHEDDLDVVVQPGMEWMELNEILRPHSLMFGPDPAPGALIGGILATNASGTNAFKFGGAKDNVISLKVVLPDGTLITTKRRPRKSSNGYNLTNLFIGSEGTLGIIVEATLKLHILPKKEAITLMNFADIGDATRTVSDLVKSGVDCNALELMDNRQMRAVVELGSGGSRKWAPYHLLLIKLGAKSDSSLKESINVVKSIAKKNQGFNFEIATDEGDKENIWHVRKTLLWNSLNWAKKIRPNAHVLPTDVCVPVSRLPELISKTMEKMDKAGLLATASGHAGDGNLHVLVIYEPEQIETAHRLINELSRDAIELDGTVSGEHGIGVSDKRELLVEELGENTIGTMRSIKFALDKKAIMNPDHIFQIDPAERRTNSEQAMNGQQRQ